MVPPPPNEKRIIGHEVMKGRLGLYVSVERSTMAVGVFCGLRHGPTHYSQVGPSAVVQVRRFRNKQGWKGLPGNPQPWWVAGGYPQFFLLLLKQNFLLATQAPKEFPLQSAMVGGSPAPPTSWAVER